MNGTVDVSPRCELVMSGEQIRDCWRLAREHGVALTLVETPGPRYAAAAAGGGRYKVATSDHPYKAAIEVLAKIERAA